MEKNYQLYNGDNIPPIAFGTGVVNRFYRNNSKYLKDRLLDYLRTIKNRRMPRRLKNDLHIAETLDLAVVNGYRLFDSGRLYGHSEKCIGNAIHKHNRDNFFIITKISDDDLKRYPDVSSIHDNLSLSLEFLQTDYVNAYLLHFPSGDWISMYRDIEREYKNNRAQAIGVCNFDVDELRQLIAECSIKPMICQVEIHPLNTKKELRKYCQENDIVVMAHTPTAHMDKRVQNSEIMQDLTKKYQKSAAQIIYRWHYQNGVIPIVSSTSDQHMKENLDIFDFELTDEEMEELEALNQDYSFDPYNNKKSDCPDFIYNL